MRTESMAIWPFLFQVILYTDVYLLAKYPLYESVKPFTDCII